MALSHSPIHFQGHPWSVILHMNIYLHIYVYIYIYISCIHTYGPKCFTVLDIIHFVLLPTLMGSYGDRWLECSWCEKWGKCLDNLYLPAVSLTDIDGIGVLCDSCMLRTEPVHYDYLRGLFLATISAANVFSPEIVERIADIAYEPCYNHRCHTEWSRSCHVALDDKWAVYGKEAATCGREPLQNSLDGGRQTEVVVRLWGNGGPRFEALGLDMGQGVGWACKKGNVKHALGSNIDATARFQNSGRFLVL
jgi:hypothetical protein